MTGEENITFGLKNKKIKDNEIKEILDETVKLVQLEGIIKKYPSQMSGGQMQRVALARAVAMKPDILLLDEPLSALDAKVRSKLRYEIKELQKKLKITTIMVTHDQEEALSMGDRIVVMNNGTVEQIGTPEEIYNNPVNAFVADFIGTTNIIKVNGDSVMVRPEDITISKIRRADDTAYNVKNIEFRGNSYRLTLGNNDNKILVDVASKEFRELSIKDNDLLHILINDKLNEKVG